MLFAKHMPPFCRSNHRVSCFSLLPPKAPLQPFTDESHFHLFSRESWKSWLLTFWCYFQSKRALLLLSLQLWMGNAHGLFQFSSNRIKSKSIQYNPVQSSITLFLIWIYASLWLPKASILSRLSPQILAWHMALSRPYSCWINEWKHEWMNIQWA